MLQLNDIQEVVIGDATDYTNEENEERHIFIFNSADEENQDTSFTAVVFADTPDEINIFSKNEKDSIRINIDVRSSLNTFYDSDNSVLGYFDEKELIVLDDAKEKVLRFQDMAFIDIDDVPFALVNDEIENELTSKYFTLPHMSIEMIDPEENNVLRNLVVASLITLTL